MIKGYKGFDKGLICRGKQYSENTVFEEKNAKLCESGMHFCEHPLDVLRYYPYYNGNNFSEYANVESPKDVTESGEDKSVTKKLKIGTKISFDSLLKLGIEFNLSKVNFSDKNSEQYATGNYSGASATGYKSGASATGNYSGASATGYKSGASATGDYSGASATGNYSGASATGNCSGASATGNCSGASATGDCSGASATGDCSGASATGYKSGASATGNYSGASATGNYSGASATGDCSGASATGDCSGASATGDCSGAMAVGNNSKSNCGNNGVALAIGKNSVAKAVKGGYIVLTECTWNDDKRIYEIIDCKCTQVDGVKIKEDTYYQLINGEFVEAE